MKSQWQALMTRLDALSLRERVFLVVSIVVVCAAVFDTLWLSPAQTVHKQLLQQLEKQSSELVQLREQVRQSPQTQAASQGTQAELLQLQAQMTQVEQAMRTLLPPTDAAPLVQALSHLLRRYPGLSLVQTSVLAPGTAGAGAAAMVELPAGLSRQGVSVTVAGNYADLTRFVASMEAAMPYVRWGQMTLSSTDDRAVPQLTLQLFVLTEGTP
jgi:MSHA biogenesis protein MshJ